MLRTISHRLLATSRPVLQKPYRPLSSSSALYVKIRHADGSTNRPPNDNASGPSTSKNTPKADPPSPAERPPAPPANTKSAPTFEPKVSQNSQAKITPEVPLATSTPTKGPNTPLTPPAPSSRSAPSAAAATTSAAKTDKDAVKPVEIDDDDIDLTGLPSLDIDSEQARIDAPKEKAGEGQSGPRQRTGAGRKEYVSSIERRRKALLRFTLAALLAGGIGVSVYGVDGGESVPQAEKKGPVETIKANFNDYLDYFNKPAFKTLLPDPLPAPHQRPYTLLIDLEGLLVSSTWDRANGWKTAKRPGVDYFLAYLSQFYEIVLFTSQPAYTAMGVAEKLDPFQTYLPYRLFRDSTRTVGGKTVKDLTYLNRDLSKVVLLDTNAEHVALQQDNAIVIKPWEGQRGDTGLVDMIPFLESIGIFAPADVRPVLKAYQGKNIPVEYAKKEAEQKQQAIDEWQRLHPTGVHGAGSGLLSSMFGSVSAPGQSRPKQPMTYLEQKRALAQAQYQEEQKYWKENEEEFKKLIEEDRQKQLAEMKGSIFGMFGGQQPKQDQAQQQKSAS